MPCPLSGDESQATIEWVRKAEAALEFTVPLAQQALEELRQFRLKAGHIDIGAGTDQPGLWPREQERMQAARNL